VTDSFTPLPRSFYARPTIAVARDLLGKLLVGRGGTCVARIVEVEAYLGERDAASHARRGPTPRAAIMFGPPGFLYVYLIYGMHHCMNVVTETDGVAGAVLLRAAAPVAGLDATTRPATGPGKLCAALGITRAQNGLDLTSGGALYVADDGSPPPRRRVSPRIGVEYAGAWAERKLRFFVDGNAYVSGPWRRRTSRSREANIAGIEAATRPSVTLRSRNPGKGARTSSATR
jgi:DNA-3-methyladenine glycosylase